ncbi:hypothetical protein TELCIR_12267, partial [Teladorsagia circumcincta]
MVDDDTNNFSGKTQGTTGPLMGLFDVKYLSNEQLKGFNSYKYSCIDSSPISMYISHPFWNWLVT